MSRPTVESRNGKIHWRIIFRLVDKQRQLRLGQINDRQAKSIQSKIDDLIRSIKLNIDPKLATEEWVQSAEWTLIERL